MTNTNTNNDKYKAKQRQAMTTCAGAHTSKREPTTISRAGGQHGGGSGQGSNFYLRVELWRSLIIFVSFFVWELGFEEVWSISYRFLFENWALNGFYFYGKVCKRIKQWWDSPSDVPTCIFTGVRNRQRVVIVESWQSAISSGPLEIAPGGFLWTRRWNVPVKNGPQWCR